MLCCQFDICLIMCVGSASICPDCCSEQAVRFVCTLGLTYVPACAAEAAVTMHSIELNGSIQVSLSCLKSCIFDTGKVLLRTMADHSFSSQQQMLLFQFMTRIYSCCSVTHLCHEPSSARHVLLLTLQDVGLCSLESCSCCCIYEFGE